MHILEDYKISIKQVGDPIDLSLLRSPINFYENKSDLGVKPNDLQKIRQMLSMVLHEYCSSQADFISNRSFFSLSLLQDRHGSWDLGLGKAMWRGFY
jgi:hypothetical protein